MKKLLIVIIYFSVVVLGFYKTADAVSIFHEEFDQDIFFDQGDKLKYKFDLTGLNTDCSLCPTTDETGFDPYLWIPQEAILSFNFFSFDKAEERIEIRIKKEEGIYVTIYNRLLDLDFEDPNIYLDFNLSDFGLMNEITDGELTVEVSAPKKKTFINDFNIGKSSLKIIASPVPEPSTVLLLSSGLTSFALYNWSRKKLKKYF